MDSAVFTSEKMIDLASQAKVNSIEFNSTDANDENMLSFVANENNKHLFQEAERKIIYKCNQIGMKYKILKPLDTPANAVVNFVELNVRAKT